MYYNKTVGSVNIKLDTKRMDGNLSRAQDKLDIQVLNDMIPYMPFQQGAMVGATNIAEPGLIVTDMGELYLTEDGRSWAHKGEKKYPTGTPLKYNTAGTEDHWFEAAKREHGKQWVDLVKREAGKG